MEKAIEIKRRAQRYVQSGDLDGALGEYLKLAKAEENDPYHSVVVADLLFKKGDQTGAAQRYLMAVEGYEKSGLYKNGIAVCKKMARLGLSPGTVLRRLGDLHEMDGLATEASLYHMQHAEHALRSGDPSTAILALRRAFDASNDNVAALEKLAELHLANGDTDACIKTLREAIEHYEKLGMFDAAERSRARALTLSPDAFAAAEEDEAAPASAPPPPDPAALATEPPAPGLAFEAPVDVPAPAAIADADDPNDPFSALLSESAAAGPVGGLVAQAQSRWLAGDPDGATELLVRAARGYEDRGQRDGAARLYRTVHRHLAASPHVLALWLRNCELRSDRAEAAEVACELGEAAWGAGRGVEAVNWFERALAFDPAHERAGRRLKSAAQHGERAEPAPAAAADRERVVVRLPGDSESSHEIGELLEQFRHEVRRQVSGDAESQYALGVSYLEMGLVDQALESLRAASGHPGVKARAVELIARCLMDRGRFDDAVLELVAALEHSSIDGDSALGLRFELGLAFEAAGRLEEALTEFERIYEERSNYPDAALKIRVLRKTMESH